MQMLCTKCGKTATWHSSRRCSACRKRSTYTTVRSWASKRRAQLAREPLCQYVVNGQRCMRKATDVDHVVPLSKGGADDPSNYQSLCHEHHSTKTAAESGFKRARA